jgi:two-component system invasion response regulator UvrY
MAVAKPYRILVVDDCAIVRAGLRHILDGIRDLNLAGEAESSSQALQLARQAAWDVILMELALPDRSGLETLKMLRKEHPGIQVLMTSMQRDSQHAVRALKSGAAGHIGKRSTPDQFIDAIRLVASGKKYISADVAQELASQLSGEHSELPHAALSNREYQTLCLIASGLPVSKIADNLALSVKTVSMYRARLLQKMQLKNNAELTHYAFKHALLDQ